MGAGGGGGETSASTGHSSVEHCANTNSVRIETKQGNKGYNFAAVIQPETDNAAMFEQFMPPRIEGFLEGYNVNIMAYGQTGSGKTHTVFGPPGILSRAGSG